MGRRLRNRSRKREVASVPMAPMIDMVFLLLVFFMTASAMSDTGSQAEVALPEAPSSQVPKDLSNRVVVSIDPEGRTFWAGRLVEERELAELLRENRTARPEMKLRIRADKATPFEAVRKVMGIAASSGIENYLYATYQSES